jgi:GntR family transcriptional regulator, transcriptional repressor for pyruvate dehydrogenase complex
MSPRDSKIRLQSAADQVRDALLKRVERGDFAVGEKLPTEAELAATFGVSRAVIREALGGMRASGALSSHRGRGTFVASQRPRNVLLLGRFSRDDLHAVRCDLEIPSAGQAAVGRTEEDLRGLRDILERLESATDVEGWVRLDADYHVAIAKAGGNALRVMLIDDLRDLHVVISLAAAGFDGRKDNADVEHREIYEAIRDRDVTRAREAMWAHLANVQRLGVADPADSNTATRASEKGAR